MKRKKAMALFLTCIILASLAGCGGSTEATGVDKDAPVVIYSDVQFNTLDPYQTNSTSDNLIFTNVYECLVRVDNNGNIIPQLAESWDVSEDGMIYTFHLAEDAYFHNGDNVKASDVVFTIEYAKQYAKRMTYYEKIASIRALDDYTVEITLSDLSPLFISYLYYLPILSESYVNEMGGDIRVNANGSGPYKIAEYDSATHCKLEAVEDYHLGTPQIKTAEFRYYSDASSAQIAFETGEIQIMSLVPSAVENVVASGEFNTEAVSTMHCSLILINNEKAPLDNLLVRKALSYGIDKQACIDIAYDGYATEMRLLADTDCFGVDFSDAEEITYDPEYAKQLLAEAGYPDGINFADYGIVLDAIPSGYYEKLAQVVQTNWQDIGVTVEIVGNANSSSDVPAGNYALFTYGYAYKGDFSYNQVHYSSNNGDGNAHRFVDANVDEAFAAADSEQDPAVRKAIYKDLVTDLVDKCVDIPIFRRQSVLAWDKNLNANYYNDVNHMYYIYDWSWAD